MQMVQEDEPITSCHIIGAKIQQSSDLHPSDKAIADVLKRAMRFSYRAIKKVPAQVNTQRCLVLWQQYALAMLN